MIRFQSPLLIASGLPILAFPVTIRAQSSDHPSWRIIAYVGEYAVDDNDAVDFAGGGASLSLGSIMGIAADFDAPVRFLGFRVGVERTFGSELFGSGGVAQADVRSMSLDARIQPASRAWSTGRRPTRGTGPSSSRIPTSPSGPAPRPGSRCGSSCCCDRRTTAR